jgi:hypothetical protein
MTADAATKISDKESLAAFVAEGLIAKTEEMRDGQPVYVLTKRGRKLCRNARRGRARAHHVLLSKLAMHIDPCSLDKFIYEIRNGVDLFFNELSDHADGWYWTHDPHVLHGPYAELDAALDAAGDASDADAVLKIIDMRNVVRDMPPRSFKDDA